MGAKFLADAVLADVIDYDEFLTGARSEATYMMFKSFLPKVRAENREQRTGCRCVVCVGVWVYVASLPTVCILTCNIFFQPVPFYLLPSSVYRLPSSFPLIPSSSPRSPPSPPARSPSRCSVRSATLPPSTASFSASRRMAPSPEPTVPSNSTSGRTGAASATTYV